MNPTQVLCAEHRVIEQILDVLLALARRARADARLDRERAASVLEFLRAFADALHHAKEEEHLFPMLVARGLPQQFGPIAVMLDDHRAGREYVGRMQAAVDAGDAGAFASVAESYAALLEEHIGKEEAVLFPMAEAMLDEGARESLLHSFRSADGLQPSARERLLRLADDLAGHFGVRLAAERGPAAP